MTLDFKLEVANQLAKLSITAARSEPLYADRNGDMAR